MIYFKKEKKDEILQGRTYRYLIRAGLIDCTEVHLGNILNGKTPCSKALSREILSLIPNATKENYFKETK